MSMELSELEKAERAYRENPQDVDSRHKLELLQRHCVPGVRLRFKVVADSWREWITSRAMFAHPIDDEELPAISATETFSFVVNEILLDDSFNRRVIHLSSGESIECSEQDYNKLPVCVFNVGTPEILHEPIHAALVDPTTSIPPYIPITASRDIGNQ